MATSTDQLFALEVEPDPRHVATARMFAGSVARHFGCEEERIQDVKVAVSEACSNSIQAHQERRIDEPVRLSIRNLGGSLRYEVCDRGPGLDFRPDSLPSDPEEAFEAGIGLTLIQALFPDVAISPDPDGGTVLSFAVPAGTPDGHPQG